MFTGRIELARGDVWQQCNVPVRGGNTAKYLTQILWHIRQEIGGNWKALESSWETQDLEQWLLDHITQLMKSLPTQKHKIHYTAHFIWSGKMLRGILHKSVTGTLQRTNQSCKKKIWLQRNPQTYLVSWWWGGGGYWSHQSGIQTYWTVFFLLLLLVIVAFDELWTEEFTNQIKHSDVLLWVAFEDRNGRPFQLPLEP